MFHGRFAQTYERRRTQVTGLAYCFPFPAVRCTALDSIRTILKNKNVVGNYASQPCIQVMTVREDDPGAITALDTLRGAGEWTPGSISVSAQTGSAWMCRFGYAYALSAGTALGQADTSLEVHYTATGLDVGTRTLSLMATVAQNAFVEITGWIPTAWAAKVKSALIARSLTGNLGFRLCFRLAATSPEDPGAWSTAFDTNRGAGEACTGELTPTFTTESWIQFGIQYYLTGGVTPGSVNLTVSTAVRT